MRYTQYTSCGIPDILAISSHTEYRKRYHHDTFEPNLSQIPFQRDLARDIGLGRSNLRDGLFQYKGNLTVIGFGAETNKRHQVFKVMNDVTTRIKGRILKHPILSFSGESERKGDALQDGHPPEGGHQDAVELREPLQGAGAGVVETPRPLGDPRQAGQAALRRDEARGLVQWRQRRAPARQVGPIWNYSRYRWRVAHIPLILTHPTP